jgi:TRAP-type mannitol/chloroaromatic compound transport system substrate-binding protein
MRTASYDMYAQNYHESAVAWDAIATEFPHIKVKTFSKDIIDAMKAANQKLLKQMSDEYPLFKETMDSQAEYQKKARVWTQISDFDYLKDNL